MAEGRYSTSDLRLGAFLRTVGFKIAEVTTEGDKVVFHFEDSAERTAQVRRYYNKEAAVEPLGYMASISEMRDMVTQAGRASNGNKTALQGGRR